MKMLEIQAYIIKDGCGCYIYKPSSLSILSSMAKRGRYIQCSRYDQRISGSTVVLIQFKKGEKNGFQLLRSLFLAVVQ